MVASERTRSQSGEVRNVALQGVVIIKMKAHEDARAHRLSLGPKVCIWSSENGSIVFHHTFDHPLSHYYPYRNVELHEEQSVTFDPMDMEGCRAKCSLADHPPHQKTIPRYLFSDQNDYEEFQSLMRGTRFVCDFATTKINCGGSGAQSSPNQCVKLWANAMLTIPVTMHHNRAWKLVHAEISARWLIWKTSGSKDVKAEFRKNRRRSSADVSPPISRRSSFALTDVWNRHRGQQATTAESPCGEEAPPAKAQKWQSFSFEFRDTNSKHLSLWYGRILIHRRQRYVLRHSD